MEFQLKIVLYNKPQHEAFAFLKDSYDSVRDLFFDIRQNIVVEKLSITNNEGAAIVSFRQHGSIQNNIAIPYSGASPTP